MIVSERTEIVGFEIEHLCCDVCGTKMEMCGNFIFSSYPPSYKYKCSKCNKDYMRQGAYPRYWLVLKTGEKIPYGGSYLV
jgi:transposase-like protein